MSEAESDEFDIYIWVTIAMAFGALIKAVVVTL